MDPVTLVIGAASLLIGFIFSGIAEMDNETQAEKDYNFNKDLIKSEKKDALDLLDLKWDKELDDTSTGFNNDIDSMQLEAKNDAFQWNLEAIAAGQHTGSDLSVLAGSGVRAGSSVAQAVDLQAGLNAAQLQNEEDYKRGKMDLAMGQILQGVNSYNGGNNYSVFSQQRNNTVNTYDNQLKKLQKEYDDYTSVGSTLKRVVSNGFSFGTQTANLAFKFTQTHPNY